LSTHLLVTNDYPPKVGGIQNYLWELYRRMPPASVGVLTTPYVGAAAFDASQGYRIERFKRFWLTPTAEVRTHIETMVERLDASFVLFDPAFPVGCLGPSLSVPYGLIVHGAETTVPARLPAAKSVFAKTLSEASLVVSASNYALSEAQRLVNQDLPTVYVPPGVDVDRFLPLDEEERQATRTRHGLHPTNPLIVSVSRLVPRKGMDRLIEASVRLAPEFPGLETVIIGGGRDEQRLRRMITRHRAPVRLLGRVPDEDMPALVGCADVFAMLCRIRWGGLEQEGFGIVFLEAAAAGVAQVAGASGGASEAVADGSTGLIVKEPNSTDHAVDALRTLLADAAMRTRMGTAARERAVAEFSYDLLAQRLLHAVENHTRSA